MGVKYEVYINEEAEKKIKELYDQGIEIYSFSKLDSVYDCPFAFYRTYRLKIKTGDNIYSYLGNKIHGILEILYNEKGMEFEYCGSTLNANELIKELWGEELITLAEGDEDLHFPTENIRVNYEASMWHFVEHFKKDNIKSIQEPNFLINISGIWVRGFIDRIIPNTDTEAKSIKIIDYKTSSLYNSEKAKEKGKQLTLYGVVIESISSYPVTSTCWNYLKYANVSYTGKTRKKGQNLMRCKISYYWKAEIINELVALGIDIEDAIEIWGKADSDGKIPEQVADKFIIEDCICEYPYNEEAIEELVTWIEETVNRVKEMDGTSQFPAKKINKGNEFSCFHLCGHKQECEAMKKYIQQYPQNILEGGVDYDKLFGD